jgi:2-C-methyl-D-erythritol 4-phosphate cytidylyltransferase
MPTFHVIIPAAGSGSRMGADIPKQYLPLAGRTMLTQTLDIFLNASVIDTVTLVISEDDTHWDTLAYPVAAKLRVIRKGGVTRAATVLNGMVSLDAGKDAWVLVHDAARPGLTQTLLARLIAELQDDSVGGLLAIPLADTLKRADNDQRVATTEPREGLWQAQTPQMFRYGLLKQALEQQGTPTDEAQAVEALGYRPKLVAGELRNLKVTYQQDLVLIEALLVNERKLQE